MQSRSLLIPCVCVLFILSSVVGRCGGAAAIDKAAWPAWRGPNGTGVSLETNWDPNALNEGPEILWEKRIGMGYTNAAIVSNRMYIAGKSLKNIVYCLDADTGEEIWRHEGSAGKETQGTPTVDGDFVYSLGHTGDLVCLNKENGELVWERNLKKDLAVVQPFYGFAGPPVVHGDRLLFTANTHGLALDKNTGELLWDSPRPPGKIPDVLGEFETFAKGTDYSAPVLYEYGDKHFVLIASWEGVHSVDVETGSVNWLYPWGIYSSGHIADPLVFDNKVFIAESYALGFTLLDISNGTVLWENINMGSDVTSPIVIDGYIYTCEGGPCENWRSFRCLEAKTGEVMWDEKLGREQVSVLGAAGKLIILEDTGMLHITEATHTSYVEISACQLPSKSAPKWWVPPVLYKGKLYCKNYGGELICIDMRK